MFGDEVLEERSMPEGRGVSLSTGRKEAYESKSGFRAEAVSDVQ